MRADVAKRKPKSWRPTVERLSWVNLVYPSLTRCSGAGGRAVDPLAEAEEGTGGCLCGTPPLVSQ